MQSENVKSSNFFQFLLVLNSFALLFLSDFNILSTVCRFTKHLNKFSCVVKATFFSKLAFDSFPDSPTLSFE